MTRKSVRKILTIARHEFFVTVVRASYLIVTLGLPVFIGGAAMLSAGIAMKSFARSGEIAVTIVDRAGVVNPDLAKRERQTPKPAEGDPEARFQRPVRFSRLDNMNAALEELKQG